ncbi:MAG: HNH endonuclease [Nitrosopumilaceae archaeon]|nr:MAG: HNH endonuclease [Nitrosopumilaceae archaeon]
MEYSVSKMKSISEHVERFWSKVNITPSCWTWKASHRHGYSQFSIGNKHIDGHIFSYELFEGKIPKGLVIDHLCRNKGCVNPAHLQLTTIQNNVLRGISVPAINARKLLCNEGHSLHPRKESSRPQGRRYCKICHNRGQRQRKIQLVK